MQIHVARGGQELGRFSPTEVRARLDSGELKPSDFGWAEGHSQWTPLSSFPGLLVPEAVAAPPPLTRGAATAPTTSGAAVVSLVCGIFAYLIFPIAVILPFLLMLPFLAALSAVICGHIARSNVKKSGGAVTGRGMALAGLIMGYLQIALIPIAILAAIALPVFSSVQSKGLETKALANAKSIAIACRMYAVDHNGAYPKTLEELMPNLISDPNVFICPFDKSKDPMGYEYYGAGTTDSESSPQKVFLVSKALSDGKRRVVVYFDTSGKVVKDMPELPPH